ncbi:hypothetical protein D3C78_1398060 [compost metagenome]
MLVAFFVRRAELQWFFVSHQFGGCHTGFAMAPIAFFIALLRRGHFNFGYFMSFVFRFCANDLFSGFFCFGFGDLGGFLRSSDFYFFAAGLNRFLFLAVIRPGFVYVALALLSGNTCLWRCMRQIKE